MALVLVGYLGAELDPVRLGLNAATVEVASVAALLIAGVAGLKRIESNVTLYGAMQRRLYMQESAGALTEAGSKSSALINKATGDVLSPVEAQVRAQIHKEGAASITDRLEAEAARSERWYKVRNASLILGVILLVVSRVLPAYLG